MSAKFLLFPAVLLSALSVYATPSCRPLNSFEQGRDLRKSQMIPAYNATGRIDIRGSWDLYATASYIFWQPREENLELGILNKANTASAPAIDGRVKNMNFHYKSGIKAGLGAFTDHDNWDSYVEYTWLSGAQRTSATAPLNGTILPISGHPANAHTTLSSGKSRWNLNLNIIDAQLARSYFVGTKLKFRPFFAGRAAWINQKYSAGYVPIATNVPYHVRNSSHSWGLGPEAGITADWHLGYGIRAIGSAEADILFTRYNLRSTEENSLNPSSLVLKLYQRHVFYLRPHSNMELGFGWDTYFDNHNYHIDILGTYGFQVFWNQNMTRYFVDDEATGKSFVPNGDLYIHGVTGEVRFDF